MSNKPTLVFGASTNPERYSNKAIHRLLAKNHTVYGFSNKAGNVGDVDITTEQKLFTPLHTITLYMNANRQIPFHDYILSLHPQRIIFNPGAENDILELLAAEQGIETIQACTLVMLGSGLY